jgi:hypothetical protein
MVKIDDNTHIDLDQLAITHYDELILPINNDGTYHARQSLIGRIKARKEVDRLIPDPLRVGFWDYFLNNNYANLRRVISSRPDELQLIINEIDAQFGLGFLSISHSYLNAQLTGFGQIVKSVFNYENYRNTDRPANYFNSYNIKYCTYCNKDEIQNIEEINNATGNILRTRLYQLDHFYPRSRYPYLSLSFFNLIPGCANCNATLKGEKNFNINTHFNPFHKRLNDFYQFEINTIIPKEVSDISISILNPHNHPNNAIEDFRIINTYNQGVVPELLFNMINLFKNRTKKVQRSVLSQLKGLSGSVEHSNNDLLEYQGVPLAASQINSKQFGKLKRDVCIQMQLI